MVGIEQVTLPQLLECQIHRIKWFSLAGQDAEFNQFVKVIREIASAGVIYRLRLSICEQLTNRHLVLGQGAGLVYAEHGGCS